MTMALAHTQFRRPEAAGYLNSVGFVAVFVLVSALPLYVSLFVYPAVQPIHWLAALLLALFPAMLHFRLFRLPWRSPGLVWAGAYTVLCLVWFGIFGGHPESVMRERLVALAVFVAVHAVACSGETALAAARKGILAAVLLGVACNVYEALNPFSFVPLSSPYSIPGRAAGLHVNANASAAALLFGMIVSVTLIPARWRWVYVGVAGVGIALTLSRAGILAFGLAIPLLRATRLLRTADVARILLLAAIAAVVGWFYVLPALAERFDVNIDLLVERILWFADPAARADFSQTERLQIAELGWQQIAERPIFGHGVGSTELWVVGTSTHNIYLQLASDFGLLGLLVMPALFAVLLAPRRSDARRAANVLVPILFVWGFFSHNVLTDLSLVSILAVAAAAAATRARTEGIEVAPHPRAGASARRIPR